MKIGSRISRVFPLVLSCVRTHAHRPYELTPSLLSCAEHNNQSTSAWGRLSSVFFSSVEPLIQVHFAVTCVKPLNTIFSDCVMLVISRRVWAYTPATSRYSCQSPQPTGYDPRVAQRDSSGHGGSRSPPRETGLSRTGLHSDQETCCCHWGASSFSREHRSSKPASLKRE